MSISGDSQVLLKRSKTNQFGRGVEVFLGATGDELCLVGAVQAYVAQQGVSPGAFYHTADGLPLTKARFVDHVRGVLARAGIPLSGYLGDSFRIGVATATSQARVSDSVIQALGRWLSLAFLRYIRTPREQLAQYTPSLTRGI